MKVLADIPILLAEAKCTKKKENEFPQKQLKIPRQLFTNLIYKFNSFPINRKDPVRK